MNWTTQTLAWIMCGIVSNIITSKAQKKSFTNLGADGKLSPAYMKNAFLVILIILGPVGLLFILGALCLDIFDAIRNTNKTNDDEKAN